MNKRGNGEGSIFKRADGRWAASVSCGQGRRKSFYGNTRQEVARRLTAALKARQDGFLVAPEKATVSAFLQRWLEDAAHPTVRATTFDGYERMVRLHIAPDVGAIRLARLSPEALSRLYRRLLEKGLSPKTVRLVHACLHRALAQAVRWRLVATNAADAVDAPRAQRKEIQPLSVEEARRLLETARNDRLYPLYVLAVTCGLRQGELLGLRWQDVNFDGATLAVCQQAQRIKGQWVFNEPKTSKGRRVVALPAFAVQALREHRVGQAEERLRAGHVWENHDLVFANSVGRPIEKQNLMRRSFWPLLERSGLRRIRFHDLRHTAATIMLEQGEHPRVVQERLGHSTISVTMDVYSHVMPSLQRDAADRLDRLLAAR